MNMYMMNRLSPSLCLFFFFNDTATTEIYTLSLHDALPISLAGWQDVDFPGAIGALQSLMRRPLVLRPVRDRKSTRLNSSHGYISYAVFCLKKKKHTQAFMLSPSTGSTT